MRGVMMLFCLASVATWTNSAFAGSCEGCSKIKTTGEGFCDHCGSGKIFGIKVTSRELYNALTGEEGMVEALKKSGCKGCKTAVEKSGACDHCRVCMASIRPADVAEAALTLMG